MSVSGIISIIVLIGAYVLTWVLFFRSLRIIKLIDKEDLRHASQIRDRLEREDSDAPFEGDDT